MTVANQVAQLIGIHLPGVSFAVVHCVSFTTFFNYSPRATFADSLFAMGWGGSILHSACDVFVGAQAAMPVYGLSLNLVAAGILLYAARRGRGLAAPAGPSLAQATPIAR